MDSSLLEVSREPCSPVGGWDPNDYHWDPYGFKPTKIVRPDTKPKRRGRSRLRGPTTCQVDSCQCDLSDFKEYHQRYKICPYHMKAKCIMMDGAALRFCQQCGRFHLLHEFDGLKQSCRPRLERHNRRRRKKPSTQRRPISARSPTLSNSNSPTESNVAVEIDDALTENEADPTVTASSLFASPEHNLYLSRFSQAVYRKDSMVFQSGSVYTPCTDLPSKPKFDAVAAQPRSLDDSYFHSSCLEEADFRQGMSDELPSDFGASRNERCLGYGADVPVMMPVVNSTVADNTLMEPVAFIPSKTTAPTEIRFGDLGAYNPSQYPGLWSAFPPRSAPAMPTANAELSALDGMYRRDTQDEEFCAASYKSLLKLSSLSLKVFNCIPGKLPLTLRNELLQAVRGGLVPEGYMRPGCVNLTMDIFQHSDKKAPTIDEMVDTLLSSNCDFWKENDIMVQTDCASRRLKYGEIVMRTSLETDEDLYPTVRSISPVCVLSTDPIRQFTIRGEKIYSPKNTVIHCRIQGKGVPLAVNGYQDGGPRSLSFSVHDKLPCGTMKIEVSKNGMIDQILPVLCVDNSSVVTEIEDFYGRCGLDLGDFLVELGLAVEVRSWLCALLIRYRVALTDLRRLLQMSGRSFSGRLGFKHASMMEFSGCLMSACQIVGYCRQQGLMHTAQYLQPVVALTLHDRIDRLPISLTRETSPEQQRHRKRHLKFMKRLFKHHLDRTVLCC